MRGRSSFLAALVLLEGAGCVTHEPCRPGTILLTLEMGAVTQVDLLVRGGGWDAQRGTIQRRPGAGAVVVEVRLPAYRTSDLVDLVVTPLDGAPITRQVSLLAGCTAVTLEVTLADGGRGAPDDGAGAPVPDAPPEPDARETPPPPDAPVSRDATADAAPGAIDAAYDTAPVTTDAAVDTRTASDAPDAATCTASGPCSPAECRRGVYSCDTGSPVCVPNGGTLVDGLPCGPDGAHKACKAGACACAPGYDSCGGTCTDTATDPRNCGKCGQGCSTGMSCVGSACVCPAGLSLCPDGCKDLQHDDANCQVCGVRCPPTTTCGGGACL
jgi:hypothetical protein